MRQGERRDKDKGRESVNVPHLDDGDLVALELVESEEVSDLLQEEGQE